LSESNKENSMRISHSIRLCIVGAVFASGNLLFPTSGGASTLTVACQATRWDSSVAAASDPPVATGTSDLRVTVPPLVLVAVEPGVLQVSTNTGRPPASKDWFYLISSARVDRAPARVVEEVLHSCR
jgi:hypothetical protein